MKSLYGIGVRRAIIVGVLALLHVSVSAGNGPRFIENKGQYPAQVQYHLRVSNADVFFQRDRLVFNFADRALADHNHDHDGSTHHNATGKNAHAYQLIFENSSAQVSVSGDAPYKDVTHFFIGNDPNNWASDVRAFEKLKYLGIYPGIDLNYFGKEGNLKYDFVVAPNADASLIAMRYEGADKVFLKNRQLHVVNSFNTVTEMRPVAYQIIDGIKRMVACEFTLNGQTVGFEFPNGYNQAVELVIDPVLIFSSYSGSVSNNFGFTATYDDTGALYGGGISFGVDYPTVTGSYNNGFGGQVDIAISKFSPDGSSLIYSTIIGGSSAESPHSMVVNSLGQLVILGSTSSSNFPTTVGAYDASYNGGAAINFPSNGTNYTTGSDIVITILNANGSALVGSTFFGGTGNDGLNQTGILAYNYGDQFRGEVIVDASNNVLIVSSTLSSDLPVTAGTFDATLGGGQDALIAKFNPTVSGLTWCCYLGGDGADAGYSLKLNSTGDVFVAGGTQGQNFPVQGTPLFGAFQGGTADGYVAHISGDGSSILNATYIGTSAYDQTYFVEVDADDDIYVYGQSLGAYPVTAGTYSNAGGRQFIQKLNTGLGVSLLSTVFGSGGNSVNISPTAFLVDVCNRIYVSGWGGSTNGSNLGGNVVGNTNGLAVTSNAFQSTTDGSDFYFMVLEADAASLLYATYFGGAGTAEHVDGGTSRFNRDGIIHQAVCAGCGGSSAFPTTPGAWSNTNDSPSGCNLGVIKLDMEITGVDVEITAGGNVSGCAPFQVQFASQLVNAADIVWEFGEGTTSNLANPVFTYTDPGTYTVMLIGTDTILCTGGLFADTAFATITVTAIAVPANAGNDQAVCGASAVQIGSTSTAGYSYSWSPSVGLSASNVAQPTANPSATQVYTLTVTDANGCEDVDDVEIDIFALQASGGTTICPGSGSVQLSATDAASWSWSPSNLVDNASGQNPNATVSTTTTFTVTASNGNGCILTDEVIVEVAPAAVANAGPDQEVCIGQSTALSANGGIVYLWSPAIFLSDAAIANPTLTPAQNITYTLNIVDANGCTATADVDVVVNPLPTVLASPSVEVCQDASVQLQASGALSYSWSPAAGLDNPTSVSPQATVNTTTTFTVTGTDINGCVNTASVTIDVFNAEASNDTAVCPFQSVQLGATDGASWAWSPPNLVDNPTAQNPTATVSSPTVFSVLISNGQGCVLVRDVVVDVFPQPVANAGVDLQACEGTSVNLNASGGVVYQWSPATYLSSGNIANPTVTPLTDINYQLTITDANGCLDTDEVSVAVLPTPTAVVSPDIEICIGGSTQLVASGGLDYSWTPLIGIDDPNAPNPTVSPTEPTRYVVTVEDANGCVDSASVFISIFTVSASASPDAAVCLGDSMLVTASNGASFVWSPAIGVSTTNAQATYITPVGNQTYSVVATNASGCQDSASVDLATIALPVPSFEASFLPSCEGVLAKFTNTSEGAYTYSWSFSTPPSSSVNTDVSFVFPNGQGPTVVLYATLEGSECVDSVIQDFSGQFFTNDSVEIIYPNVITPNDDGLNDCFKPGFTGVFSDCYTLVVYNRWGALLFESIATGHCWDGRTKAGNYVPEGTYYYIAKVLDEEHAGWVQVILE